MTYDVRRFADAEAVARRAADEIARAVGRAIDRKARCSLVLAGGTTPRRVYEILGDANGPRSRWKSVDIFWGDERCVPPDSADSNFAMAKTALLDRIGIPEANVHRIRGELGAGAAAEDYERVLRTSFGAAAAFDLVLLGMGEDGHTASLFPGHPALNERQRWTVPVETEAKAPRWRVSLTLPALSAAEEVFFLVTGAGKRAVLADILRDPGSAALRYPAAAVLAKRVVWFADEAALGDTKT